MSYKSAHVRLCFPVAGKYGFIYAFIVKLLGILKVKKCLDEFHVLSLGTNLLQSCNEFNFYRFVTEFTKFCLQQTYRVTGAVRLNVLIG